MRAAWMLLTFVAVGCSSSTEDLDDGTSEDALRRFRALSDDEKVGAIAFGETKSVAYSDTPLYRAVSVHARAGDEIDAWVRGERMNPKAWIISASSETLASNDDADATTRHAHVRAVASTTGEYFIVFREKNRKDGLLTVSLADRDDSAPPDEPAAPDATLVYGFAPGEVAAAVGQGQNTQRVSRSYEPCRRKTTTRLDCGGWVSLARNASGTTTVTVGAMTHGDFYTYVRRGRAFEGYVFPPAADNRFWQATDSIELGPSGHATRVVTQKDSTGAVRSSRTVEVTASNGAVDVYVHRELDVQSSCGYEDDCRFRVLAN